MSRSLGAIAIALSAAVGVLIGVALSQSSAQRPETQPATQGRPSGDVAPATTNTTEQPRTDGKQGRPSGNTAEQDGNADANWMLVRLTGVLAALTIGLLYVGFEQWQTHVETLTTNKSIERAYVGMSAYPPGVDIQSLVLSIPGESHAQKRVQIQVKIHNSGNTPANVTYTVLQSLVTAEPLPARPPYDETKKRKMWVSVVKGDNVTLFNSETMSIVTLEEIKKDAALKLYVFGFADYIDKFGSRHRSGFARVYHPAEDDPRNYLNPDGTINQEVAGKRSNLKFVTEPNYNYDRERDKGEGYDWDEPAK